MFNVSVGQQTVEFCRHFDSYASKLGDLLLSAMKTLVLVLKAEEGTVNQFSETLRSVSTAFSMLQFARVGVQENVSSKLRYDGDRDEEKEKMLSLKETLARLRDPHRHPMNEAALHYESLFDQIMNEK